MTEEQLSETIRKYLSGEAGEEERKQIEQWYESFDVFEAGFPGSEEGEQSLRRSLQAIREKIAGNNPAEYTARPGKKILNWRMAYRYPAAAIIAMLISGAAFLLVRNSERPRSVAVHSTTGNRDVQPGGDKAILTLGNGQQIILDSAGSGLVSLQGNTKIIKLNNDALSYNQSAVTDRRQPVQMNTITTPRGGKYEIVLPDGSKVWLNAASSIRFPTAFTGKTREVDITGEAYFEIEKNAEMPFIAKHNNMEIKVLGTSFNVMAYEDEEGKAVTLVEGAVEVSTEADHDHAPAVKLRPGQQVTWSISGDGMQTPPLVKNVNVNETIAWKDNLFWFDNDDIQEVIKKISRWYNIKITVDGDIADRFTGAIPMNLPFSKVVGMLQKTGRIQYKIIDDRNVIFSQYAK